MPTACAPPAPVSGTRFAHPREGGLPYSRRRINVATTNTMTVAGAFENRDQARRAVDELLRAGFTHDQIGWVERDGGAATGPANPTVVGDTSAEKGAAVGA